MKKLTLLLVAVLLVLTTPLAGASEPDFEAIEKIAVDIEALVGAIEGLDPKEMTATTYEGGLTVYSVPLPAEMRTRLEAASASSTLAKDFAPLAVGMQLTDPTSFSSLIHAADALLDTEYQVWCAVVNLRDNDQTKKTTLQMKGEFKVSDTVTYPSFTLNLPTTLGTTPDGLKIVQLICKVTGGGKAKSKFVAN